MNRQKYYSSNETKRTQYKITAFPINSTTKDKMKYLLKPSKYAGIIKNVNLKQKVSDAFLKENILNVGNIIDKSKMLGVDNVSFSDFIFIDFEEPKKSSELSSDKTILSFDKCVEILKENNLNYVLSTSHSHTNAKPRLHLLLALLKPIKDADTYTFNWTLAIDKLFQDYYIDKSCKNMSRWIFPSRDNSDMRCDIEFSQDDFEVQKLDKELAKIEDKVEHKTHKNSKLIPSKALLLFNQQVKQMYGYEYDHTSSNGVLKYLRDNRDKTANIWYAPYYYEHKQSLLFDHQDKHAVLFIPEDFEIAIDNPKTHRDEIQETLKDALDTYFAHPSLNYLITNEGLGKSTTILKYAQYNDFLFSCATKKRVLEVSDTLTKDGIAHYVVLSNVDILENNHQEKLIPLYKNAMKKNKKLSLKSFVKKNITDHRIRANIFRDYNENLKKMKDENTIRICTTKKLQVEILKAKSQKNDWYMTHQIIFDEFSLSEWSIYKEPEKGEQTESLQTIWNKPESYVNLAINEECFFVLLKLCSKVLILTTERHTIEIIMYGRKYSELTYRLNAEPLNEDMTIGYIPFEKKILDTSLHYLLCQSTRVDIRKNLINDIKKFSKNFKVISNNAENSDYTHEGVKGSNAHQSEDILIIGTLRTEMEDNILYHSGDLFFNNYTKKHNATTTRNYIKQVQLTTQVSQSIGRNSGFRRHNTKTIVVLPILQPNSKKRFDKLPLQYVTPNVRTM